MNFSSFIAFRVATSGQRSFARMIIRIAVIAVALSMTVMVVATALITGFKQEIADKIFGFWGHIHISNPSIDNDLLESFPVSKDQPFYPELNQLASISYSTYTKVFGRDRVEQLETKGGIKHIQVYALRPGIIKANDEIEGIILKGIGADFNWSFLADYLIEGDTLNVKADTITREILISQQTAQRLKVTVGDRFVIHFVERQEVLKRRFTVRGIYRTGLEEYDRQFALVDIRQIQQLLKWNDDQVSGFEVFVEHLEDLGPLTQYIYFEELPSDLYAESIRQKVPEIFDWLDLQDINEVVILSLMIIVAIINMMTALLILILERTNMIGILKALGGTSWNIRKIFLYYAAYIVVLGLFWGNILGLLLCFLQDQFGIVQLDEANYYLSVAPIAIDWGMILILNLGTLLVTLLFLLIPSYLVTRISPVRSIRFK